VLFGWADDLAMGRVLDSRAVIQDPNIAKRPEVLFATRSSDGPNSGTELLEVWGIVLNQQGTCAQVPPVFCNSGTLCTHALVLGRKGECVTFVFNNFSPHVADPKHAKMSLCKRHGLHASP
jgi:hypothetical protein